MNDTDDTPTPADALTHKLTTVFESFGTALPLTTPTALAHALRRALGDEDDALADSDAHVLMNGIQPLIDKQLEVYLEAYPDASRLGYSIAHTIGHYLEAHYLLARLDDDEEEY